MWAKCTVFTDNSTVAYINRKIYLTALEQRWMDRLAPFDIDIKYKAGWLNMIADALSRKRVSQEDKENIMDDDEIEIMEMRVVNGIDKHELRGARWKTIMLKRL